MKKRRTAKTSVPTKTHDDTTDRAMDPPTQDPTLVVQFFHDTGLDVPDQGSQYLHCGRCLDEWQAGLAHGDSPKEYARQQAALTADGIQLWCTRHDWNISLMRCRALTNATGRADG